MILALGLSNVLYFLAGVMVGVLGVVCVRIIRERELSPRSDPRWKDIGQTLLGIVVLALTLYTVSHTTKITECQTRFNQTFARALIDRSTDAESWRDAQQVYLDVVADPQSTRAERLAALNVYRQSLRDAAKRRDENPLPSTDRCG